MSGFGDYYQSVMSKLAGVISGAVVFEDIKVGAWKQEVDSYPSCFILEGVTVLSPVTTLLSTNFMDFTILVVDHTETLDAGRVSVLNKAGEVKDALENDRWLTETIRKLEVLRFLPNWNQPHDTFYRWECAIEIRCEIER